MTFVSHSVAGHPSLREMLTDLVDDMDSQIKIMKGNHIKDVLTSSLMAEHSHLGQVCFVAETSIKAWWMLKLCAVQAVHVCLPKHLSVWAFIPGVSKSSDDFVDWLMPDFTVDSHSGTQVVANITWLHGSYVTDFEYICWYQLFSIITLS